jgi:hypothetical protein
MPLNYTVLQVNHILSAYKSLFPSTEGELANYWDYGQTRPWSCLTTDFHKVSIETIRTFDAAVRQIDSTALSHQSPRVQANRSRVAMRVGRLTRAARILNRWAHAHHDERQIINHKR